MASLTRKQVDELKSKGLSDQRISQLARARGLSMPSENVGGFLGTLGRVTGVEKLGQGLGYALFQLTPEYKELQKNLAKGDISPEQFTELATGNITPGEVVGSAVRTAGSIASAGGLSGKAAGSFSRAAPAAAKAAAAPARVFGNIARGAKIGTGAGAVLGGAAGGAEAAQSGRGLGGIVSEAGIGALGGGAAGLIGGAGFGALGGGAVGKGILTGLKTGARSGGTYGALGGLATSIEDDKTIGDTTAAIAGEGIRGAAVGGAAGALLGGVSGGISQAFKNRAQRKADIFSALQEQSGPAEATGLRKLRDAVSAPFVSKEAAPYKLDETLGKAVKDKAFVSTLRDAAVPADDLALVKASTPADRAAYRDMLRIAQSDDVNAIEKPVSRAGRTFIESRVKPLVQVLKDSGRQIDAAARSELDKPIPAVSESVTHLSDDLAARGVAVADDGALSFDGSDFEDLPGVQRLLNTVWKRARGLGDNGFRAHQLKRFIDTQLEYGKSAEGIGGAAERLVKGFRSSIDGALDAASGAYNAANTRYATAINAKDTVQKLLGRDFGIDDNLASMRAGEVMSRILGNAAARPLQALNDVEVALKSLGIRTGDSVIAQVRFADLIEDMIGAPSRSLAGQIERAGNRVVSMPEFIQKSVPFAENAQAFLQGAMSRTAEQRIEALARYINSLD